jgi:hypothetical protein
VRNLLFLGAAPGGTFKIGERPVCPWFIVPGLLSLVYLLVSVGRFPFLRGSSRFIVLLLLFGGDF